MSISRIGWAERKQQRPAWVDLLDVSPRGELRASVHNTLTVLREHEDLTGVLRYDELADAVIVGEGAPWPRLAGAWSDTDAVQLAGWLSDPRTLGLQVRPDAVYTAAVAVARERPFHPVRDWLVSLKWDREPRLAHWLSDLLGAARSPYTEHVGTAWLVSAAARAMEPGCKVDLMVVLEGRQGAGKTRAVRALAGAHWYAEATESPASKDFYQSLRGRWIVEIGELQSFSRAEASVVKGALSRQVDVYRPSYGRSAREHPRSCIFVATTNESDYLRDPTGARRFLPVVVGEVDVAGIELQREQLWAEALDLYRGGWPHWQLPPEAIAEQDDRYVGDPWQDAVSDWLEGRADAGRYADGLARVIDSTTASEVLAQACGVELARQGRTEQMRVGAIMRRLGWARRRCMSRGARAYQFTRPPV